MIAAVFSFFFSTSTASTASSSPPRRPAVAPFPWPSPWTQRLTRLTRTLPNHQNEKKKRKRISGIDQEQATPQVPAGLSEKLGESQDDARRLGAVVRLFRQAGTPQAEGDDRVEKERESRERERGGERERERLGGEEKGGCKSINQVLSCKKECEKSDQFFSPFHSL